MKKIIALTLFVFTSIQAQQTIGASGGEAIGSGGTVSYSVGQIVYTTHLGINGSFAQGVQQPYEISVVLGIDAANDIQLITILPNPTVDYVFLKVGNYDVTDLSYQLIDTNGRLIESRKLLNTETTILMNNLPSAIYFLKVLEQNKQLKTFKIIKN